MGNDLRQLLERRWGDDWLIGVSSHEFWQKLERNIQDLENQDSKISLFLIPEVDPLALLAKFFAALSLGHSIALANPHWGAGEWDQVRPLGFTLWSDSLSREAGQALGNGDKLSKPHSMGTLRGTLDHFHFYGTQSGFAHTESPKVLIPTGGTSGSLKFAVHTWQTLMASVEGFRSHFEVDRVQAYCVLPLFHVSGLMQALRVFTSGGRLVLQSYRDLKQGKRLPCPAFGFLSLVPTQLQWLLEQGEGYLNWLRHFRAVLLGGAPAWSTLLQQARQHQIPLAPTYGMTETASQVATLLPEQFLAGVAGNGRALPHAQILVLGPQHEPLADGTVGQIAIAARSMALGYLCLDHTPHFSPLNRRIVPEDQYEQESLDMDISSFPHWNDQTADLEGFRKAPFLTDDMGFLDSDHNLHIVGRCSTKLITGGENVFPEDLEAVLLALEGIQDACVVGLPDEAWGQRLCAVIVSQPGSGDFKNLAGAMRAELSGHQCPKAWIKVESLPRTIQGKVNRKLTLELAQKIFGSYDHRSMP
jgi:O-succinylbenzoic acid--CoA ligase